MESRLEHKETLRNELAIVISKWDREELLQRLYCLDNKVSFPVGPVNTMTDLKNDPQLEHRAMISRTQDGKFIVIDSPIKMVDRGGDACYGDRVVPNPPRLGADTEAIKQEFTDCSTSSVTKHIAKL